MESCLDEISEELNAWPTMYIVKCRYRGIDGLYTKTEEELENAPVYFNSCDNKYLYFTIGNNGSFWVIDNDKNSYAAYYRSSKTHYPARDRPDKVFWYGVQIFAVSEEDIDEGEDDCEINYFEDEEFPATFDSIGGVDDVNEEDIKWLYAEDICSKGGKALLFNKIEPNDVSQGAIGDCWLLAAISALAEFPSFIENKLFQKNEDLTEDRKYCVSFYDVGFGDGEGTWNDIEVDSRIPCNKQGLPMFAQTIQNEMYVLLLEKAFAKYAGAYNNLSGGFTSYAWMNMTGCEEQYIWSKNGDENFWIPSMVCMDSRHENPTDFQTCYTVSPDDEDARDYNTFWEYLVSCDKKNFMMSTSIGGDVLEKPRTDGLVERHAYSLLSCKEMDDVRLVCLRNPWGNSMEWNGDWSDGSSLWQENPMVDEMIGESRDANDGKFWMSYDDFLNVWESVYVSAMSMPNVRCSHVDCHAYEHVDD